MCSFVSIFRSPLLIRSHRLSVIAFTFKSVSNWSYFFFSNVFFCFSLFTSYTKLGCFTLLRCSPSKRSSFSNPFAFLVTQILLLMTPALLLVPHYFSYTTQGCFPPLRCSPVNWASFAQPSFFFLLSRIAYGRHS